MPKYVAFDLISWLHLMAADWRRVTVACVVQNIKIWKF